MHSRFLRYRAPSASCRSTAISPIWTARWSCRAEYSRCQLFGRFCMSTFAGYGAAKLSTGSLSVPAASACGHAEPPAGFGARVLRLQDRLALQPGRLRSSGKSTRCSLPKEPQMSQLMPPCPTALLWRRPYSNASNPLGGSACPLQLAAGPLSEPANYSMIHRLT